MPFVPFPKVWDIEDPKILMIWSPAKQQFLGAAHRLGAPLLESLVGMGFGLEFNFSHPNNLVYLISTKVSINTIWAIWDGLLVPTFLPEFPIDTFV